LSDWLSLQDSIDKCEICRSASLPFEITTPPPTRPPDPLHVGRLLLISEAPPRSGGFWRIEANDILRKNLLRLLAERGFAVSANSPAGVALRGFVSANFFLIQALKWSLNRGNFNQLTPGQQQKLTEHSAPSHVGPELILIEPQRILAMGSAALQICRRLAPTLPQGGVEELREKDLEMPFNRRVIPLNVTYLPVSNMRFPGRVMRIKRDLGHFLSRNSSAETTSIPG
jgi:hypothetical protein